MATTRGRFVSDGECRLYRALVKVYGPHSVQGHVSMGDIIASETTGLSDAELRYLRLALSWPNIPIRQAARGYDGLSSARHW
jgi:hypothetical protein